MSIKICNIKSMATILTVAAFTFINVAHAAQANDDKSSEKASEQSTRFAITHAKVYTVSKAGVLDDATVVVEEGKIVAIHSGEVSAEKLKTNHIIDGKGYILTPGFIGSMNSLGLVEVGAVSGTRDSYDEKADVTFDASLAFNPKSTLVAYTRKGGITSNIVSSHTGDSLFAGQTFAANLSGDYNSVMAAQNGVVIHLGSSSKGSRAKSLQALDEMLFDAKEKLAKDSGKKEESKGKKKPSEVAKPKRSEQVVLDLLSAKKPLIAYADRATDLLALLALKKKYNLDLVLVGASDAILIKDDIAKANVSIIMSPLQNLPGSFDSLHASLTNAAELSNEGVNVVFAPNGDAHNLNQLRFDAGVAVANGFDYNKALQALTSNVAELFKLNTGRIEVGKQADLVLWSADPFELSSRVESMWINGLPATTLSRQDALRKRYMTTSDMPKAYIK